MLSLVAEFFDTLDTYEPQTDLLGCINRRAEMDTRKKKFFAFKKNRRIVEEIDKELSNSYAAEFNIFPVLKDE